MDHTSPGGWISCYMITWLLQVNKQLVLVVRYQFVKKSDKQQHSWNTKLQLQTYYFTSGHTSFGCFPSWTVYSKWTSSPTPTLSIPVLPHCPLSLLCYWLAAQNCFMFRLISPLATLFFFLGETFSGSKVDQRPPHEQDYVLCTALRKVCQYIIILVESRRI